MSDFSTAVFRVYDRSRSWILISVCDCVCVCVMWDHQYVSRAIEIFIPSLIRELDEMGKLRKLFRVEILFNGRKHFVLRRYSEFQTLHRKLKKILRAPDFPSKRNQHLRTKPLEQRRQELEDYIQVILYENGAVPQELLDFLQVKHFHLASKNCNSDENQSDDPQEGYRYKIILLSFTLHISPFQGGLYRTRRELCIHISIYLNGSFL
ncbi:sorting nexin-24-like [Xyrauchen texanus]|uniref:sorting nexin-24-like n=1 Tax=Xyrauchen texanus TaxID=154827 RepID=UPI002242B388|nr:sorting nexin-24-like [Xyrauchen texanus]